MEKVQEFIKRSGTFTKVYEFKENEYHPNIIEFMNKLEEQDTTILYVEISEMNDVGMGYYNSITTPNNFIEDLNEISENAIDPTIRLCCQNNNVNEFNITTDLNCKRIVLSSKQDIEINDIVSFSRTR